MSKALLICNGEKSGPWLKKWAEEADFILAADGGADGALDAGIIPHAVIGDLDSVSSRAREVLKDIPFIHVSRQDNTDLEKALNWLVAQKFTYCTIVGATGKRLDFTIGNMLSIYPYVDKMEIVLRAENWTLFPLKHSYTVQARPGARASLIALSECRNITLSGFQYEVKNATWQLGQTGLSNVITADCSTVSFQSGYMLLYVED